MSDVITIIPKRVKWGFKAGFVKTFMDGHKEGIIQAYQKGGGKHNNSGPSGGRTARFYPDRMWRKTLGKHGIKKIRVKMGLPC